MELDPQSVINFLFTAVGALGGYVLNSVRQSISQLQATDLELADKVHRIDLLVAGTYVKRDDMDKLGNAIFAKLDRIEAKLDGKVDK